VFIRVRPCIDREQAGGELDASGLGCGLKNGWTSSDLVVEHDDQQFGSWDVAGVLQEKDDPLTQEDHLQGASKGISQ
jgi:hypothetical protein